MALRNGLYINAYHYSDIDPIAQKVARHRIRRLQTMYPISYLKQRWRELSASYHWMSRQLPVNI